MLKIAKETELFGNALYSAVKQTVIDEATTAATAEEHAKNRSKLRSKIQDIVSYGTFDASLSIEMSQRLHWWLRSLGHYLQVLEPVALRGAFVAEARALAGLYD